MNTVYLLIRRSEIDEMTCILGSYSSRPKAEAAELAYHQKHAGASYWTKIEPISLDQTPKLELYV